MKFLFIHQNYPGQFKHLASAMAVMPEHKVFALVDEKNRHEIADQPNLWVISYATPNGASKETHRYLHTYEGAIRRGQQTAKVALELKNKGFEPDIICVHAGWGEALFLKEVFPKATIVGYFEYFYRAEGADVGFDSEYYEYNLDDICRIKIRNSHHLLSLESCDWGITPTLWQANQLPSAYHPKISIIHEGIDTDNVKPNPEASFKVQQGPRLTADDKVITFVNRNLEPYRGFHIFMRALPKILEQCPDVHVVLVGEDNVSYGPLPKEGGSWRKKMMAEVGDKLDMRRVHFVGKVPYDRYLSLLQISSAHVYLTYPFVLSWSMLEAMAAGCIVIASDTPPVKEVVQHEYDGLLVDFFDHDALAKMTIDVVNHPDKYQFLREQARTTIIERYDLKRVCLPQQISLLNELPGKLAGIS
ncbi:MAG TPA: glycosyltransferase family 4 protein [Methylophilaceae bacterium]